MVESSIENLKEWALEGESKQMPAGMEVDETESRLRYQMKHMVVCDERM